MSHFLRIGLISTHFTCAPIWAKYWTHSSSRLSCTHVSGISNSNTWTHNWPGTLVHLVWSPNTPNKVKSRASASYMAQISQILMPVKIEVCAQIHQHCWLISTQIGHPGSNQHHSRSMLLIMSQFSGTCTDLVGQTCQKGKYPKKEVGHFIEKGCLQWCLIGVPYWQSSPASVKSVAP